MQGYGPALMAGAEVITMLRSFDIRRVNNTFYYDREEAVTRGDPHHEDLPTPSCSLVARASGVRPGRPPRRAGGGGRPSGTPSTSRGRPRRSC